MTETSLKNIEYGLLLSLVFLFPLAVLSIFTNPFVTPKLIVLGVFLVIIFILKAIRNATSGSKGLIFHTSVFDVPVILIVLAYTISAFISTPNKMEAFWLPGTASFIIGAGLIYFAINQLGEIQKAQVKLSLIAAASAISFVTVLVGSGVLKAFSSLPAYARSDAFSTMGSMLSAVIFISVILPIALNFIFKSQNITVRAVSGVSTALIGIAIVISLFTIVKNWGETSLPGMSTSWIVASESLKNQPLFGVGPGNYLSAFTKYIPLSYNATAKWSLRFANAENYYLTVVTETGLIGFAAVVVLLFAVYKRLKSQIKETNFFEHLPLLLLLLSLAVFPASPSLVILLFTLLALESKTHVVHLFSQTSNNEGLEGKIANIIVATPTILISLFLGFLLIQATRSEIIYQKALNAVASQDGKGAYDIIRDAIQISPYADRYHVTYAQLNLALANAIAQKKDLSQNDKDTVSQLVQQAIREGRSAVLLNSQRAGNWEVLASIYKSVMPLAKGADQFALQTYSQAVALDPVNPNTRVSLGGIYYSLKRYEEAIDVFKLAAVAKPDLANSHYNLAIAYRDNSQYDKALTELTGALTLVPQGSKDYDVIKKEIENVQSRYPKKNTAVENTENLTPPTKLEDNAIGEKVELPSDATPPATPVSAQ